MDANSAIASPALCWRRHRLASSLGLCLPPSLQQDPRPWHAVVCSHLGRSLRAQHHALAVLFHWTQVSHEQGAAQISVSGTAAAPWVDRACRLLRIQPQAMSFAGDRLAPSDAGTVVDAPPGSLDRDGLAILLADSVDVVWLRRGGKIDHWLQKRLTETDPGTVRLLSPPQGPPPHHRDLLDCGAVAGIVSWPDPYPEPLAPEERRGEGFRVRVKASYRASDANTRQPVALALVQTPENWLIHCTRTADGAWPGESQEQFHDSLLLTPPQPFDSTPLTALRRIVAQGQLIGSGRTVRGSQPVVCLSDRPLLEIVDKRHYRSHLGRWDAEPYGIAVSKTAAIAQGARAVVYAGSAPNPTREQGPSDPNPTREQGTSDPNPTRERGTSDPNPTRERGTGDPNPTRERGTGHPNPTRERGTGDPNPTREQGPSHPNPTRERGTGDQNIPAPAWLQQPVGRQQQWLEEREWRLPGPLNLQQCGLDQVVVFVPSEQERARFAGCPWPVVDIQTLGRLVSRPE